MQYHNINVFGYETKYFSVQAKEQFEGAIAKVEEWKSLPDYLHYKRALEELAKLIDKAMDPSHEMSSEQAHELLQRIGIYNYKSGMHIETGFVNKELVERKLEGGGTIVNQFKGKKPEEIWKELTHDQKSHFVKDHHLSPRIKQLNLTATEMADIPAKKFFDLPNAVQEQFTLHVQDGEYAKGGKIPSGPFYVSIKPLREGGETIYTRISPDQVNDFVAGYVVYKSPTSNKQGGYLTKDQLQDMIEQGDYTIVAKEEANKINKGELPVIVSRAVLNPVTNIGQLSKVQIRELNKYVKKGLLDKGKGGPFPIEKTVYAIHGFDFKKDREDSVREMLEEVERLEPGTVKFYKMAKGGTIDKDTILLPRIIAEGAVWNEFEKDTKLKTATPEELYNLQLKIVPWLEKRADELYKNSKPFKTKVSGKGEKGRNYLWAMMEHWTKAWLKQTNHGKKEYVEPMLAKGGILTKEKYDRLKKKKVFYDERSNAWVCETKSGFMKREHTEEAAIKLFERDYGKEPVTKAKGGIKMKSVTPPAADRVTYKKHVSGSKKRGGRVGSSNSDAIAKSLLRKMK